MNTPIEPLPEIADEACRIRSGLRRGWGRVAQTKAARNVWQTLNLLYNAGDHAVLHDGIEHAGYLAFLGLLALFPFIVFVVALAGHFGGSAEGYRVIAYVFDNIPPHLVDSIRPRIQEILSGPPQGLLTLAIVGSLWTTSSAVDGYRTVLNRAFRVSTIPNYWIRRVVSVGQVLLLSCIMLLVMLFVVLLPIVQQQLPGLHMGALSSIIQYLAGGEVRLLSLGMITFAIANFYYILPNTKQRFVWVLPGALIAAIGWLGAARIFSSYLSGVNRINLIYGSLGGIIAVLVFFYVINVIFIYGAEFNYLLRRWYQGHVPSKELP